MNWPPKIPLLVVTLAAWVTATAPIRGGSPAQSVPVRLANATPPGSTYQTFEELLRSGAADELSLVAGQKADDERSDEVDPAADFPRLRSEKTDQEEDLRRQQSIDRRITELKKPVDTVTISATAEGATPENLAAELAADQPMISISALGIAPPLPDRYIELWTHRPLYYEQPNLERCGNGCGCWQNKISAAQFLWNTALLPYHLGRQRCHCPVQAGGDCLSCQSYPPDCKLCPFSCRGMAVQAAALAGFTFLLL